MIILIVGNCTKAWFIDQHDAGADATPKLRLRRLLAEAWFLGSVREVGLPPNGMLDEAGLHDAVHLAVLTLSSAGLEFASLRALKRVLALASEWGQ